MNAPIDFDPNLVVVGADVVPPPTLTALEQFGTYVQAVVELPALTGATLVTFLRIYRAPSAAGPWKQVDGIPPSPISQINNLYDLNPPIGRNTFYCATAVNALGSESAQSAQRSISAQAT